MVMKTAKQDVQAMLQNLPDSCSLEDIQYHLYVLSKVRRGEERLEQAGGVNQSYAEQRLHQWVITSSGHSTR